MDPLLWLGQSFENEEGSQSTMARNSVADFSKKLLRVVWKPFYDNEVFIDLLIIFIFYQWMQGFYDRSVVG